jgi:hypothetical protein
MEICVVMRFPSPPISCRVSNSVCSCKVAGLGYGAPLPQRSKTGGATLQNEAGARVPGRNSYCSLHKSHVTLRQ